MNDLIYKFLKRNNALMSELENVLSIGVFKGWKRCTCPKCSHTRKNKSDKCLGVRYKEGDIYVICHNCGWKSGATTSFNGSRRFLDHKGIRFGSGGKVRNTIRKISWI